MHPLSNMIITSGGRSGRAVGERAPRQGLHLLLSSRTVPRGDDFFFFHAMQTNSRPLCQCAMSAQEDPKERPRLYKAQTYKASEIGSREPPVVWLCVCKFPSRAHVPLHAHLTFRLIGPFLKAHPKAYRSPGTQPPHDVGMRSRHFFAAPPKTIIHSRPKIQMKRFSAFCIV